MIFTFGEQKGTTYLFLGANHDNLHQQLGFIFQIAKPCAFFHSVQVVDDEIQTYLLQAGSSMAMGGHEQTNNVLNCNGLTNRIFAQALQTTQQIAFCSHQERDGDVTRYIGDVVGVEKLDDF